MNTKIILAVVLAIVVIAAWAVNAHRNKGFRTVSSEEFAQIIGDTATVQLLDVRTKEEYEEGHIADALLPNIQVTVTGETPIFDKLSPFLDATEKWLIETFTSDRTFSTICGYAEDNPTKVLARQIVCYEAFRRALPHLDVILTPNGFGIVNNQNIVPASKERINRLLDALLDNRDAALLQFIPLLYAASQWNKSEQCKFFAATMFPNMEVTLRLPSSPFGGKEGGLGAGCFTSLFGKKLLSLSSSWML